jgi:hypothetical protein
VCRTFVEASATGTLYSSGGPITPGESEQVVQVTPQGDGRVETFVIGPRHPKTREDVRAPIVIHRSRPAGK